MPAIVRAISIRQPWVELILRGIKKEEYRSRPTTIRERVYLYASARPADAPEAWLKLKAHPGDFPQGRIIGTVEIVDCYWNAGKGAFAYLLRNPKRLRSHLQARNQPQPVFWRPQFE
jgi:hypothetical protein